MQTYYKPTTHLLQTYYLLCVSQHVTCVDLYVLVFLLCNLTLQSFYSFIMWRGFRPDPAVLHKVSPRSIWCYTSYKSNKQSEDAQVDRSDYVAVCITCEHRALFPNRRFHSRRFHSHRFHS